MCETLTMKEFQDRVIEWRSRYAVNELALMPRFDQLGWFEDKKCIYHGRGVTLQCYWNEGCSTTATAALHLSSGDA